MPPRVCQSSLWVAFLMLLCLAPASAFAPKQWTPVRRSTGSLVRQNKRPALLPTTVTTTTTTSTSTSLSTSLPSVALMFTNPSNSHAALALIVSTFAGINMDRRIPGSGILSTLSVATLFATLRWAPASHALYSASWSTFLPASLVFLLLSLPVATAQSKSNGNGNNSIMRLAIPFGIACAGSILGCASSFFVFTSSSISSSTPLFASLRMSPHDALVAASCLAASFVGGSVNFLATAATLPVMTRNTQALISSMATADVLVMAVYLSSLSALMRSSRLSRWFGSQGGRGGGAGNGSTVSKTTAGGETIPTRSPVTPGSLATAVSLLFVATGIVRFANQVEPLLAPMLPGTACAVVTLVTPLVQRLLFAIVNPVTLQSVAGHMFEICFLLLFASMGMSTNLATVLQKAPLCVAFSSVALAVHGLVALVGTKLYRQAVDPSITLADTLVASNAAIGGAATAAAFAGQAPNEQRRGLVLAGTVWGVVGYAVGTTAGLSLYRILRRFI